MQEKWQASEWLGLVTAGSLWVPLHDPSTRDQGMQSVIEQIKLAVPTIAKEVLQDSGVASTSAESEDVHALSSELEALRKELAQAVTQSLNKNTDVDEASTEAQLAAVPAMVPALSLNCRPTPDMEKLKAMLISADGHSSTTTSVTSEKNKVGALGRHRSLSLPPLSLLCLSYYVTHRHVSCRNGRYRQNCDRRGRCPPSLHERQFVILIRWRVALSGSLVTTTFGSILNRSSVRHLAATHCSSHSASLEHFSHVLSVSGQQRGDAGADAGLVAYEETHLSANDGRRALSGDNRRAS